MATTDERLRRGGASAQLSDISSSNRPNSFGDAPAAARDSLVRQISTSQSPAQVPAAAAAGAALAERIQSPAAAALSGSSVTRDGNSYSGTNVAGNVSFRNADGTARTAGGSVNTLVAGFSPRTQLQTVEAPTAVQGKGDLGPQSVTSGGPAGQVPGAAAAMMAAPVVRHSGNDWQSRNDLRNAEVSASSIMNNGGRWDQHKGVSPERAAYQSALQTDAELRLAQPGMEASAMRENAGLQRAGMQQQGETARAQLSNAGALTRAVMQEQGDNQRAQLRASTDVQTANIGAAAKSQGSAPAGYRWSGAGALEAIPGGPADQAAKEATKPLNDVQSKALQFGARMQTSGQNLDQLAARGVDQPGLIKRAADAINLGAAANWTQSPEQQQVEQSQRDFVNAVLRRESGAAIADHEFDNAKKQYFPQVGDSPEVIAQKQRNREIATSGVLAEVPGAEKRVGQVVGAAQAPAAQRPQERSVARSGVVDGRKVVQYSDGSIDYAN